MNEIIHKIFILTIYIKNEIVYKKRNFNNNNTTYCYTNDFQNVEYYFLNNRNKSLLRNKNDK